MVTRGKIAVPPWAGLDWQFLGTKGAEPLAQSRRGSWQDAGLVYNVTRSRSYNLRRRPRRGPSVVWEPLLEGRPEHIGRSKYAERCARTVKEVPRTPAHSDDDVQGTGVLALLAEGIYTSTADIQPDLPAASPLAEQHTGNQQQVAVEAHNGRGLPDSWLPLLGKAAMSSLIPAAMLPAALAAVTAAGSAAEVLAASSISMLMEQLAEARSATAAAEAEAAQEKATRLVQEAEVNTLKLMMEAIKLHEMQMQQRRDTAEAACRKMREELQRAPVASLEESLPGEQASPHDAAKASLELSLREQQTKLAETGGQLEAAERARSELQQVVDAAQESEAAVREEVQGAQLELQQSRKQQECAQVTADLEEERSGNSTEQRRLAEAELRNAELPQLLTASQEDAAKALADQNAKAEEAATAIAAAAAARSEAEARVQSLQRQVDAALLAEQQTPHTEKSHNVTHSLPEATQVEQLVGQEGSSNLHRYHALHTPAVSISNVTVAAAGPEAFPAMVPAAAADDDNDYGFLPSDLEGTVEYFPHHRALEPAEPEAAVPQCPAALVEGLLLPTSGNTSSPLAPAPPAAKTSSKPSVCDDLVTAPHLTAISLGAEVAVSNAGPPAAAVAPAAAPWPVGIHAAGFAAGTVHQAPAQGMWAWANPFDPSNPVPAGQGAGGAAAAAAGGGQWAAGGGLAGLCNPCAAVHGGAAAAGGGLFPAGGGLAGQGLFGGIAAGAPAAPQAQPVQEWDFSAGVDAAKANRHIRVIDQQQDVFEGCGVKLLWLNSSQQPVRTEDIALGRELNRGSYGKVYEALDTSGHVMADLVIKVYHPASDKWEDADTYEEFKCLKLLQGKEGFHQAYGSGFLLSGSNRHTEVQQVLPHRPVWCNVQPRMKESLADLAKRRGGLDMPDTLKYLMMLLRALHTLHRELGDIYAHRDIKPSNVLLDDDGQLYLADFGSMACRPPGRTFTLVCGTLHYLAPEVLWLAAGQAAGTPPAGGYDESVDIWAALLTALYLLCGEVGPIAQLQECAGYGLQDRAGQLLQRLTMLTQKQNLPFGPINDQNWDYYETFLVNLIPPMAGICTQRATAADLLQMIADMHEFYTNLPPPTGV